MKTEIEWSAWAANVAFAFILMSLAVLLALNRIAHAIDHLASVLGK